MPSEVKLKEFVAWVAAHITGDEKGQAQIFLDRLFHAFGQPGSLDVGGTPEFRVRKSGEDGGGTAFADYVWKPVVLIEMKKHGEMLEKHRTQAFEYWTRLVPNRPRFVVLVAPRATCVTAPGRPKHYPDATKLVTEDCIKPVEASA